MCDVAVGAIAPIHSRFKWMDFLHGHLEGSSALIIPRPQPFKNNIQAIAKPFQSWVKYIHKLKIVILNVLIN